MSAGKILFHIYLVLIITGGSQAHPAMKRCKDIQKQNAEQIYLSCRNLAGRGQGQNEQKKETRKGTLMSHTTPLTMA